MSSRRLALLHASFQIRVHTPEKSVPLCRHCSYSTDLILKAEKIAIKVVHFLNIKFDWAG